MMHNLYMDTQQNKDDMNLRQSIVEQADLLMAQIMHLHRHPYTSDIDASVNETMCEALVTCLDDTMKGNHDEALSCLHSAGTYSGCLGKEQREKRDTTIMRVAKFMFTYAVTCKGLWTHAT